MGGGYWNENTRKRPIVKIELHKGRSPISVISALGSPEGNKTFNIEAKYISIMKMCIAVTWWRRGKVSAYGTEGPGFELRLGGPKAY